MQDMTACRAAPTHLALFPACPPPPSPQVLPLQADMLPSSEKITSDIRRLLAGFDPSKPLSFTLTYTPLPPVTWSSAYTGLAVAVKDNGEQDKGEGGGGGGALRGGGGRGVLPPHI
jgi:hypothetical protein